jgi:hypothetical protein
MPEAEFEPTMPVFERAKAFQALDFAATVIGLEGSSSGLIGVLSRNFPGGTEENQETPIMLACVPAEIRNEHVGNTSLELYR